MGCKRGDGSQRCSSVLYHTSFAKPYDGYKSLSSNLKWVNYRPETVLHDPYLKRDDHLDIKTSIMDYHRLTGEVPGFPEYHIPSHVLNGRQDRIHIWEQCTLPRVQNKYHKDIDKFSKEADTEHLEKRNSEYAMPQVGWSNQYVARYRREPNEDGRLPVINQPSKAAAVRFSESDGSHTQEIERTPIPPLQAAEAVDVRLSKSGFPPIK